MASKGAYELGNQPTLAESPTSNIIEYGCYLRLVDTAMVAELGSGIRRRPIGRTRAEFEPLMPAEERLVEGCAAGKVAAIRPTRPRGPAGEYRIRAGFIRFLALGGDESAPVHEQGVQVKGAWIEGDLNLEACAVPLSLVLVACKLDGKVALNGAQVRDLYLDGTDVNEVSAEGIDCRGNVFLRHEFRAARGIKLTGARIDGNLELIGSRVEYIGHDALQCERIQISGDVQLSEGFLAKGMVSFRDARVGANFSCARGVFDTRGAPKDNEIYPLVLDGAEIKGNLDLTSMHARGTVRLMNTAVGGSLVFSGANFDSEGKDEALAFDDATIGRNVFLNNGFSATGAVRLLRARVGADLICQNAVFGSGSAAVLALSRAEISGRMFFRDIQGELDRVVLTDAHVGALVDDPASWERVSSLELNGFRYDAISGSTADRISWLDRQRPGASAGDFSRQPWEQLAYSLSAAGRKRDATVIRIATREREWRSRWSGQKGLWRVLPFVVALPEKAYGLFFGYGYTPARGMALLIALFWIVGGFIYQEAAPLGVMAPTDPKIYLDPNMPPQCRIDWVTFSGPKLPSPQKIAETPDGSSRSQLFEVVRSDASRRSQEAQKLGLEPSATWSWRDICSRLMPSEYTHFQAFLYSLDVVLPFVNLRQVRDWAPRVFDDAGRPLRPITGVKIGGFALNFTGTRTLGLGYLVRLWEMIETIVGWALSALLAAAVTGLIKKDPSSA